MHAKVFSPMGDLFEYRAYWPDRDPELGPNPGMCKIYSIDFQSKTAEISNGEQRFFPRLNELRMMLYTTVNDINDTKIFQDDIVEKDGQLYVVVFKDGTFVLWSNHKVDLLTKDVTIVTNMHETERWGKDPELMKRIATDIAQEVPAETDLQNMTAAQANEY